MSQPEKPKNRPGDKDKVNTPRKRKPQNRVTKKMDRGKRASWRRPRVRLVAEFLYLCQQVQEYDDMLDQLPPRIAEGCPLEVPRALKPYPPPSYTQELHEAASEMNEWKQRGKPIPRKRLIALVLNWYWTATKDNPQRRLAFRKQTSRLDLCTCEDRCICSYCKDGIRENITRAVDTVLSKPGEFVWLMPNKKGQRPKRWPCKGKSTAISPQFVSPFHLP